MTTQINRLTGNCKEFAIACYDSNSIDELQACTEADKTDCETWKITAQEWRDAVNAALADKIAALEENDK